VRANDIRKFDLGTVSFRDFCNQDEIQMPSYLSVISVVDHHKTALKTGSPPIALIGDVQSCNVLIAEQTLLLNEKYSVEGMQAEAIQKQLEELTDVPTSSSTLRIIRRLLQKQMTLQSKQGFYIHPQREFIEYLTFLHAILDDTDLLTKVSNRDIECAAQLLNCMKSLQLKREVEIISLDKIPRDSQFAKAAAKEILQNSDMYSIYRKSYALREKEIENNLSLCAEGRPSSIFLDTKVQNGCCRVGQTKMFSSNVPLFQRTVDVIRMHWCQLAQKIFQEHPEVDLHIHMISTIASAEEVYNNLPDALRHRDEMWFWIPSTQQAKNHLAIFLNGFQMELAVQNNEMSIELLGSHMEEVEKVFSHNFLTLPVIKAEEKQLPITILRFRAGSINSRKSMVAPYLPRLLT